jgi:hypothetical protein
MQNFFSRRKCAGDRGSAPLRARRSERRALSLAAAREQRAHRKALCHADFCMLAQKVAQCRAASMRYGRMRARARDSRARRVGRAWASSTFY